MKSGISKIMAVFAAMLAFSSCEKDKELPSFDSDERAIRIIPEIASPYTKSNPVTDGKETEFNNGDMIALLCNDGHVTYKLTDKGWKTTDNYYLRWGSAPVSYSAFYPATETSTTFGNFELQSSQRTADRLAAADYMTCTVADAVKTSDGSLRLEMERQMSKVSFTLSGIEGSARVQGFRVWTSTGFTEGHPNSDRMYISPYIVASEGTVSGQNGTTYTAIVVPSEADDSKVFVTFNYKGKDITLTGVPELKKGFRYDMRINISETIISIDTPSVDPWDESTIVIPGGDAEKVPLLPYFVKPQACGTRDGHSWENAMGMTEFLNMIKQKNGSQSESDENADNVDDRDFYFTGGTYSVSQVKVEYSGYGSRVKFRVHGGYDPASTGTDVSRKESETIFDGGGSNRFITLGNQTEPTFDSITFTNLKSGGDGCIMLAAGGSGDSRVNFTNCTFKKCTASGGQNPIIMVRKGLAKLDNVIFDACRAEGGVRGLIRLAQKESRVYLNACTFVNNTFGGGGFGLLVHLNDVGGNVCLHNVTFAGNDSGCGATGAVNGTGGMLIASSTIVASNANPAIRCESDPKSGSRLINSLIIQEQDRTAIDMSSSGRKLKSLGGNVIVGSINANGQYEAAANDDTFANRAAAAALALSWNSGSRHYLWNGSTSLTKLTLEQLRSAIKSYSNTNTGKLYASSAEVYDGSKAGEDFLGWLDSINAFGIYGNGSAVWPGSYQGN